MMAEDHLALLQQAPQADQVWIQTAQGWRVYLRTGVGPYDWLDVTSLEDANRGPEEGSVDGIAVRIIREGL